MLGDDYDTPDGTCVRDYVHVDDLAAAHESALEWASARESGGAAFNLGTGRGSSVLEVLRAVERVTGEAVPRRTGPRRPGDVSVRVAAADRARAELGWTPRFTRLEEIVETAWAWHRTHPDGYGDRAPRAPA